MNLTKAQRATLKAFIQSDATAGPMLTAGDAYSLLAWCNASGSTAAWRTAVEPVEMDDAPDYSTFDSIQQGKRDSWGFMLNFPRNFARNKVRKWITDVWGPATANSNAAAILLAGTENATNAQGALGGTTKTTDSVSALDRNFSGAVDVSDVNLMIAGSN